MVIRPWVMSIINLICDAVWDKIMASICYLSKSPTPNHFQVLLIFIWLRYYLFYLMALIKMFWFLLCVNVFVPFIVFVRMKIFFLYKYTGSHMHIISTFNSPTYNLNRLSLNQSKSSSWLLDLPVYVGSHNSSKSSFHPEYRLQPNLNRYRLSIYKKHHSWHYSKHST